MVFQVKTIFSYQREAGTAKWMTPFAEVRWPLRTVSCMAESQQAHAVVMTASRRSITGIAGVPDAACPPGTFSRLHVESCGDGPERGGAEDFGGVRLKDDDVKLRETADTGADDFFGARQRGGQFADFGDVAASDDETVEGDAQGGVGRGVGEIFAHGRI